MQEPTATQHGDVRVAVQHTEVQPLLLGQVVEVPVERCLVAEGVRRPDLDARTVLGDAADLAEHVVRFLDVFEEVRGEDLVDRCVVERIAVLGEVEHVVDVGSVDEVEADEPGLLGLAAAQVDPYRA